LLHRKYPWLTGGYGWRAVLNEQSVNARADAPRCIGESGFEPGWRDHHDVDQRPAAAVRGDHFVVGIAFLPTTFEVSTPPHQEAGTWKMVVDGVELTRNH